MFICMIFKSSTNNLRERIICLLMAMIFTKIFQMILFTIWIWQDNKLACKWNTNWQKIMFKSNALNMIVNCKFVDMWDDEKIQL